MLDSQIVRLEKITNAASFTLTYHLSMILSLCLVSYKQPPHHHTPTPTPTHTHTHLPVLDSEECEQCLRLQRPSVRGKPVCWRLSMPQSVSCPQLSTVLQRFIPLRHTFTHQQKLEQMVWPRVFCPTHPGIVPRLFIPLPWWRTRCRGEVARLKQERATVPIFRPVNKLQKQMDLGAEIHLAPLEWLKPPIADLFQHTPWILKWENESSANTHKERSIHIFHCC